MNFDKERAIEQIRSLVAESIADGDPTGWFERLYAKAEAGEAVVPWADGEPNPNLVSWASGLAGAGKRALVPGCGLGYDAEFLAALGFDVTAFDISPTGIEAARRVNPASAVHYQVADLTDLPPEWLVASFYALIHAAADEVRAGRLEPGAASDVLRATLCDLFLRHPR